MKGSKQIVFSWNVAHDWLWDWKWELNHLPQPRVLKALGMQKRKLVEIKNTTQRERLYVEAGNLLQCRMQTVLWLRFCRKKTEKASRAPKEHSIMWEGSRVSSEADGLQLLGLLGLEALGWLDVVCWFIMCFQEASSGWGPTPNDGVPCLCRALGSPRVSRVGDQGRSCFSVGPPVHGWRPWHITPFLVIRNHLYFVLQLRYQYSIKNRGKDSPFYYY